MGQIGQIKYSVVVDKKINTDIVREIMTSLAERVNNASLGKVQLAFDIETVDFEKDFVRHIAWVDGRIPDWWQNREWTYYSSNPYNHVTYILDESNWDGAATVGGFNTGVWGWNATDRVAFSFIRWSSLVADFLGVDFKEGMEKAIMEEMVHGFDNWAEKLENIDLAEVFDVKNRPITSEGSNFDAYVVHARDSRYPRWEHDHIINKLRDNIARWFVCADCVPIPLTTGEPENGEEPQKDMITPKGLELFYSLTNTELTKADRDYWLGEKPDGSGERFTYEELLQENAMHQVIRLNKAINLE